jgi:hypothetical protein
MSPAEAGAIEYEEPDWKALFEEQCARWPKLPRYLQEDSAFTEVMRRWRRFHWTPIEIEGEWKKNPAGATEAIIALAKLGVTPPRSAWQDIPHGIVVEGYQYDDHMWLSIAGEQWRIVSLEDRIMILEKGFQADRETKQIDLNRARWDKYTEAAVEVINAMRAP